MTTTTTASPAAGSANSSTLSDWAGPYVTNMLGQAQAIAAQPYQTYQGPLTAGPSSLQSNLFSGLGSINIPSNYGQSWSSQGAPTMPNVNVPSQTQSVSQAGAGDTSTSGMTNTQMGQPGNNSIAAQYMNPYLQQSLTPQLNLLAQQAQTNEQSDLGKLTSQGAFGGSRQAVLQGMDQNALLGQQANLIGQGYNTAYQNAMQQFNNDQTNANQVVNTLGNIGGQQQAINQAGVTADYNEFVNQRNYPQTMVQFEQSMLQGLPISTVYNQPATQTPAQQLVGGIGTLGTLLQNLGMMPTPTPTPSK